MLKKPITYTNVDGQTVTENFYFNMTKAELLKLELSDEEMGFKARVESIQGENVPGKRVIDTFDWVLRHAFGVRTPEGKFVKTPAAFDEFLASEAYSVMLFDLATNGQSAAEFINAIMPANLASEVQAEVAATRKVQDVVNESRNVFEYNKSDPENVAVPEAMSEEELLDQLGVSNQDRKPVEQVITNGYTDDEIWKMTGPELAQQPKAVLLRAYWLKQNRDIK